MIFNCQVDSCLYDIDLFERVLRTWLEYIGYWIQKIYFHICINVQRGGSMLIVDGSFLPGRVKT